MLDSPRGAGGGCSVVRVGVNSGAGARVTFPVVGTGAEGPAVDGDRSEG